MPTSAAEVVFDKATKLYPGRTEPAVDNLSLTVPAGEICVLVGPSGSGKTTALKLVNRLIYLTEGEIRIDGRRSTTSTSRSCAAASATSSSRSASSRT
jgi:ABC-type proline/glycine betaine transport systems, ATPase components